MRESTIHKNVMKWVRSQGGFAVKINDRFTSGIPDLWLCIRGRGVWVELKQETGRIEALQLWTIGDIQKAGGEAYVCRSLEEVKGIFDNGQEAGQGKTEVPGQIRRNLQ